MLPVRVPRGPGAAPAPARWPGTEAGPSKGMRAPWAPRPALGPARLAAAFPAGPGLRGPRRPPRPLRCRPGPLGAPLALSAARARPSLGGGMAPPLWPVGLVGRAAPRPMVGCPSSGVPSRPGGLALGLRPGLPAVRAWPLLRHRGPPSRPGPWPRLGAPLWRAPWGHAWARLRPLRGLALGPPARGRAALAGRFPGSRPRACPCRGKVKREKNHPSALGLPRPSNPWAPTGPHFRKVVTYRQKEEL